MSYVVLRYLGHPAFFKNSIEMLKRWNPMCTIQCPADGVALVLGVSNIEQLDGLTEDWAFDPEIAAQWSQKLGFDVDESDNPSP